MDIDKLKLILDALNGVGEGAYVLGLLYVLEGYVAYLVNLIIWPIFFYFAYKGIIKITYINSFLKEVENVTGDSLYWGAEKKVFLKKLKEKWKKG